MVDHPDRLSARLRELKVFDVQLPTFEAGAVPSDPAELFQAWLVEAIDADVPQPHAMTLSTVDPKGRPNARVLILKGLTDGRWRFASSRMSCKGQELQSSPWAAATFYWPRQGRQVRIRGGVSDAGAEESACDFLARPAPARAESLIGRQSQPLDDPGDLASALDEAYQQISDDPHLVAEHWTLYDLIPDEVEFWQADADRRHTRLRYQKLGQKWQHERLWP